MAKVKIVDLRKKKVGDIELSDDVFGVEVNEGLLYEVLKAQLASRRAGSAATKGRSLVRGAKRKIYRQKGTGRARHGTIRAPNFVGGGQSHGPTPRSYAYRPPRKMRIGAMRSALSLRLKEGRLIVVDKLELEEIKTKALFSVLDALEVATSALIVDSTDNERLRLSSRNLPKHLVLPPEGVNLYDVLRHEHLVLTKDAVAALEARFGSRETVAESEAAE
jgi:large subunit ribosomal protein L4